MIRAVLDTNTLVSGLLVPGGMPARIVLAAFADQFLCFSSDAIVAEVLATLRRPRIQRKYQLDAATISRVTTFLSSDPVRVPLTVAVHGAASHPEDDLILATALSARADYLVTGDRQLQALGSYQGVQIVSPRTFLGVLDGPDAVTS
ncbi:MAG: putative toxin-antitoxin system toxin component, PIN family [Chloroflexota bacterium]